MKRIGFVILIFTHLFLSAQNLVNNPSFEVISSCGSQATLAVNWLAPTQVGTSDLYNTCAPNRVPSNGNYYQWPRTGSSFTGIFCIEPTYPVREYLHSQLSSTLIPNNFYYVKFYVVLSNFSKDASNNLALYLSNNIIYQSGAANFLLNYIPQIKKFNNPIISDTLNWIEISGIYQAIGFENYITIGNFNDNTSTTTKVVDSSKTYGAYYFIDDVSIENITTPQWQYRDTTIYLGDSVLIGPAITGLNVDWFDMSSNFIKNAPGIYVKPTINTSYQATETFNSAVYNHTVNVIVLNPVKVDEYKELQNSVSILPNPSNGSFKLQFDGLKSGKIDISIYDVTGKLVYQNNHQVINTLTNFDIDVKRGLYFVKIEHNEQIIIKKLMIE